MHTAAALTVESFAFTLDGAPAALGDVLPGFGPDDRLAVVARGPLDALGAATLLLAAVTAFYDTVRAEDPARFDAAVARDDCVAYPDYFVLHAGGSTGSHEWLEVWPEHKEVDVADEPEALVRALNDRAVTRLLVPEADPRDDGLAEWTRRAARGRLRTGLVSGPAGRVAGADVEVTGTAASEEFVAGAIARSAGLVDGAGRAVASRRRAALAPDGRPREAFRRAGVDEALARLAGGCPAPKGV